MFQIMKVMILERNTPRRIVVIALGVWLLIFACVFLTVREELDMDSVFYVFSSTGERTVIYGPTYVPPPENPPLAVVVAFVAVGVVVGLPAILPKKCFSNALRLSTIVIGLALAVTILRLGILLTPVLALQLWALRTRASPLLSA